MKVIEAANPNSALAQGIRHLLACRNVGTEHSRNGPVVAAPSPVTTATLIPAQRVLFSPLRDANPFFHLLESVWMLAGSQDVAFPAKYAQQLQLYSDDGVTLNGAYGFRWREYFGHDQLEEIIEELTRNPGTRRCVLSMWCGEQDLISAAQGSSDVPCNTHIYFRTRKSPIFGGPELDMTVCCRSNDAIWGAHGANAVHFSFLLEYVAAATGMSMGVMYQVSNNYHVYTERQDVVRIFSPQGAQEVVDHDYYRSGTISAPLRNSFPMIPVISTDIGGSALYRAGWLHDARAFLGAALTGELSTLRLHTNDPFFTKVAIPMARAHALYKGGNHHEAFSVAPEIGLADWRVAAVAWLQRRKDWTGPIAVGGDTVGGTCD